MKHGGSFLRFSLFFWFLQLEDFYVSPEYLQFSVRDKKLFFTVRGALTVIHSLCRLLLVTPSDWYHLPLQTIKKNSVNYGSVSFGQKHFQ